MPHSAVRRPFGVPKREPAVPHSRYLDDRLTGSLELEISADRERPLVLGAGWIDTWLEETVVEEGRLIKVGKKRIKRPPRIESTPHATNEIVRRGSDGQPVVPGSALKGAVRQVYELLTPSCEPSGKGACQVQASETSPNVCPACSVFGAPGFAGRARFQEAVPAAGGRAWIGTAQVPLGWPPKKARKEGTYRVYRQSKDPERQTEETTRVAWGRFSTRLNVINLSDEELGLVLVSLGVGWDGAGPKLRVGGKKYHGFGAVDVSLTAWRPLLPHHPRREGDELGDWADGLAAAALAGDPKREATWRQLHRVLGSTEVES